MCMTEFTECVATDQSNDLSQGHYRCTWVIGVVINVMIGCVRVALQESTDW